MRVIKKSTLRGYWRLHAEAEPPLRHWLRIVLAGNWRNIQDVRQAFPHADAVTVASGHTVTVFNIGGGQFRLVVAIKYRFGIVYIRDFLTHAQYSKGSWKGRH